VRGDRDPGGSSASERLRRAARAARELSDALWDSLQEELSEDSSERARALARRLGDVSSTVALLLGGAPRERAPSRGDEPIGSPDNSAPAAPSGAEPARAEGRVAPAPPSGGEAVGAEPVGSDSSPPPPEGAGRGYPPVERRTPPQPVPPPRDPADSAPGLAEYGRTRLVDEQEPATVMPFSPVARGQAGDAERPEIAIHDVRREEGAAAWISSVGWMLVRHSQDHLPFAVLLVEIVDVAHLERSETPHDLHGIVAQVESALGRGMRDTDELSRETLGRYWLLAPDTNGTGARMLAERLAQLVRGSTVHRGVPMEVAIGIAVCPEDGIEAPMLAARADLGVYSARATGRSIARTEPPPR
jgi:GGDEF domain-containing protein